LGQARAPASPRPVGADLCWALLEGMTFPRRGPVEKSAPAPSGGNELTDTEHRGDLADALGRTRRPERVAACPRSSRSTTCKRTKPPLAAPSRLPHSAVPKLLRSSSLGREKFLQCCARNEEASPEPDGGDGPVRSPPVDARPGNPQPGRELRKVVGIPLGRVEGRRVRVVGHHVLLRPWGVPVVVRTGLDRRGTADAPLSEGRVSTVVLCPARREVVGTHQAQLSPQTAQVDRGRPAPPSRAKQRQSPSLTTHE
jgi:hypothetical protein